MEELTVRYSFSLQLVAYDRNLNTRQAKSEYR
jgi:hypothetical protein